jgi:hypothetical protein
MCEVPNQSTLSIAICQYFYSANRHTTLQALLWVDLAVRIFDQEHGYQIW